MQLGDRRIVNAAQRLYARRPSYPPLCVASQRHTYTMKKEMKTHSRKHDGIDAIHQLKQPITLPLIFELFPPIIAIFCRIVSSFLCRSRRSWHDWPRFVPRFLFALWSKESTELIINGRKWTHKLSIYSYVHRPHHTHIARANYVGNLSQFVYICENWQLNTLNTFRLAIPRFIVVADRR